MNLKFKIIAALFILGILTAAATGTMAEEKTKEYHESWAAGNVQTLKINNKFGEIKVTGKGGSEVTVDVVVTVEAPNERRAEELLELINVSFGKTGNTISAETHISSEFKSRQKFSIDYEVNIPSDKNLDITNKYGNTFVNMLNAGGTFDIQYGNFSANELNAPASGSVDLSLAYGKADVETASDLSVKVQYSTINFGKLDDLKLNSKYTVINLLQASSVEAESKYDTFNFGNVGFISGNTKYTKIRVDELTRGLNVDAGYGGIKVNRMDSGFESVSVTSSYGQVSLGLGDANYSLEASCDYCGISYPESKFSGDRLSENHTRKVKGKVGDGSGGSVYVKSRYGQIKLD